MLYINIHKCVISSATHDIIPITTHVTWQTKNIIYCITCKKCKKQYVGESDRTLQKRFSDHRDYVTNQHFNQATGEHFNLKGHKIADMQVTILEKVHSRDEMVRKERESMFIKQLNSKYKGINKKSWIANCNFLKTINYLNETNYWFHFSL